MKNNHRHGSNGDAPLPAVREAGVSTPAGSLRINGISSIAPSTLSAKRVKELISGASRTRILVVGDVMLDEFIWGSVRRISPEAPVPVVQLERESFMPGGAANVARNLAALKVPTELFSIIGRDLAGKKLKRHPFRSERAVRGLRLLGFPEHYGEDAHHRPPAASREVGSRLRGGYWKESDFPPAQTAGEEHRLG